MKNTGKIKQYATSSVCLLGTIVLLTGIVGYNGLVIELRVNHAKEYCTLCSILGLKHQVKQVNKMEKYYAIYQEDALGGRVEIFDKELLDEEKNPVLVKTIRR